MQDNNAKQRIVFMGTPEFALPALRALTAGAYAITVVTQPDRPAGRGGRVASPPVKTVANELGLPVMQPLSLKDSSFREEFAALKPDLTVLVAYGEYVAPSLLDLPRRASINLHPSLLPRWRGSTPIQSAILAGDTETGVSIIKMDRGLDTGPIIAQRSAPLGREETQPELSAHLAQLGADLLAETVPRWLSGEIEAKPQSEEGVTLSRTLSKEDGEIDWSQSAEEIARRVRALQPWPGTFTHADGKMLKILRACPSFDSTNKPPGTLSIAPGGGKRVLVQTGSGSLELLEVQPEGKAAMPAQAFISGYRQLVGDVLGRAGAKSGNGMPSGGASF